MNAKLVRLAAGLMALVLGACSVVQPSATIDPNALATSVSGTLTAAPTQVLPAAATDTAPPPSPSEAPPEPSATSEPEITTTPSPSAAALSTGTPTKPPPPSPTSGPTSTLPAGDVLGELGDPTWRDTLEVSSNWPLGEDSFTRAELAAGELRLTGLTPTDGWRLSWPTVQDFYLEMTVRTGDCSGNDRYGLMLRVPDLSAADRGYLAAFTCDGRYSLRAWNGETETMTSLIGPTASVAIVAGSQQENRIGIWAEGEQLALYANGTLLSQVQDDLFTGAGSFGIFVGARQTEEFTIYVDQIAYWDSP